MGSESKEVLQKLELLEKNTTRILFYLNDDPKTNHKGIPSRLDEHEGRIKDLETDNVILKTEKRTAKYVAGAIGGGILVLIKYIGGIVVKFLATAL
jgi:hypothetical protein